MSELELSKEQIFTAAVWCLINDNGLGRNQIVKEIENHYVVDVLDPNDSDYKHVMEFIEKTYEEYEKYIRRVTDHVVENARTNIALAWTMIQGVRDE